jgi:sulfate/thiosulfate-binding protein
MTEPLPRPIVRPFLRRPGRALDAFALTAVVLAVILLALGNLRAADRDAQLRNVSYSTTGALYRDLNAAYDRNRGELGARPVAIAQSHGGSARQSRAILDGAPADVATLASFADVDALRKRGLLADGWSDRLPHHSVPYTSTVVFVVRKGNPRHIHEFADLVSQRAAIVVPDPKTSGDGKLAFLAAWGSVLHRGDTAEAARAFVTALYAGVVSLDEGAREASNRFVYDKVGDVLLTWESEAFEDVAEAKDDIEVVYPTASLLAEPCVAWVDANVQRRGTGALAKSYLEFLFTEPAQEIMATHHYRPLSPVVLERHRAEFPRVELFPIGILAADWDDAQRRFFDDNGVFDAIVPRRTPK